jgi:alkanesulfonate monooxygenase SsuD/methylene tetrahydromethanopterin reductase-like flavin-dependent oxidoreductase (luciferase family)
MEFGVFLPYGGVPDEVAGDGPSVYDRMLDLAKVADGNGFGYVWVPEHHLIYFNQSPSALLPLVQIAQHTSNVRLGAAVIVLPYHDQPIQTAGEIAQADHLVGGRLEVGVARGAYAYEFKKLHIPFEESLGRFIENLEAIRLLLENEGTESSFSGKFVNFEDVYVWPRPLQRPRPPFWMASQTAPAIEDGARRGYDVMHATFLWDDDHVADMVGAFERGKAQSERSDQKFAITKFMHCAEDEADVEARIDELLEHWRIHQQLHDFSHSENPLGIIRARVQENEPTKDEIRKNLMIGTESWIREKVEKYQDMGVSMINVSPFVRDHERARASLERFGNIIKTTK